MLIFNIKTLLRSVNKKLVKKIANRHIIDISIVCLLFIGTLLIYKHYTEPRTWYNHFEYLAKSLLNGMVSVDTIPEYYQDVNHINSHKYLPFPPMPAVLLIPFSLIFQNITQQTVSIIIGSFNVALVYLLLKKITRRINAIFLVIFLSFGTVYFWASIAGTAWYYAHIVAFLFLTVSLILSINCKSKTNAFLSGLFFALSGLSRLTVVFGGIFFLVNYWRKKKYLLLFLIGASIFIPIFLLYNHLRFGNVLETGYMQIYRFYIDRGYVYSIHRIWFPNLPHLKYLDYKSIIYHLYTFLIMPPEIRSINPFQINPSPFGMGIIFTSPLLFSIFKPLSKKRLELGCWLGAAGIALSTFFHYAQGWVQFGYRFLIDFLPFLLIIMAIKFKQSKINIILFVISLIVTAWGTKMAIKLGW